MGLIAAANSGGFFENFNKKGATNDRAKSFTAVVVPGIHYCFERVWRRINCPYPLTSAKQPKHCSYNPERYYVQLALMVERAGL
jgi:hypothetical protein